jgi:hypothetical protein
MLLPGQEMERFLEQQMHFDQVIAQRDQCFLDY